MSGPMASGKSTYVKTHLKDNDIWVSRDTIRLSLLKEDESYFSHEKQVFDLFVNCVSSFLNDEKVNSVYADATFLTDKTRKKFLNQLNLAPGVEVRLVLLDTSLHSCLKRNEKRQGRELVPEEAIVKAWEDFERRTNIKEIKETIIVSGENLKNI